MRFTQWIFVGGVIASAIATSPASAGGTSATNPFKPSRVYQTPAADALTYTDPDDDGIPYRWWVELGAKGRVSFTYYVGAKSWWEPANPPEAPGWTHNSNWVALTLTEPAWVTIHVGPALTQPCAPPSQPAACDATGRTGSDLYPAVSLYSGQDTTSVQEHTFNPVGDGWWSTILYEDSSFESNRKTHVLAYKKSLPAGQYTINIGGAGAKSPDCDPSAPCYSGGQSYQAMITTSNKK